MRTIFRRRESEPANRIWKNEEEEEEEEEDQDDDDLDSDDRIGKEVDEVGFGETKLAELKVKET